MGHGVNLEEIVARIVLICATFSGAGPEAFSGDLPLLVLLRLLELEHEFAAADSWRDCRKVKRRDLSLTQNRQCSIAQTSDDLTRYRKSGWGR
jgi:hypothetical protein